MSSDGETLAYVALEEDDDVRSALHLRRESDDVRDRSLYSLGALRFAPDGGTVLGVGAVNGGVVGLHVFDDLGRRCLSNCDLRAGSEWEDYVRPPGGPTALHFDDSDVSWDGSDGQPVRRRWAR